MGRTCRFFASLIGFLCLLPTAQAQNESALADQARDILRKHCGSCHNYTGGRADLSVFNVAALSRPERLLVKKGVPQESELMQLVEYGTMPPGTRPKVPEKERKILRDWITAGAPPFTPEYEELYALTHILNDVRAARGEGRKLTDERYITLNHLLNDDKADLDLQRAALSKALNQLSTKAALVPLTPIDPAGTVYRIKLSELGWDVTPFLADPKNAGKGLTETSVNLYDLLLLEYPLATLPDRSDVWGNIIGEYLAVANPLRPIPYVRGDWLVSVATQPPLYHDLLRLPLSVAGLERRLGMKGMIKTERTALMKSAVVRSPRLIERRSTEDGHYWRTYDLAGKKDDNIDAELRTPNPSGGAAIFPLLNGLPGYFVADSRGMRLDAMPFENLDGSLAKNGVRTGLACMICHTQGLNNTGIREIDDKLIKDNTGFTDALRRVLSGFDVKGREPLKPAANHFLKEARFPGAEQYLLASLDPRARQRAVWHASYVRAGNDEPVRALARAAESSPSIVPIDAHGAGRAAGKDANVNFELSTVKWTKDGDKDKDIPETTFRPGEAVAIVIRNRGQTDLHFELAFANTEGQIDMIFPFSMNVLKMFYPQEKANPAVRVLKPGETFRFPPERGFQVTKPDEGSLAKQQVIVYAAADKFPVGIVLNPKENYVYHKESNAAPSEHVGGRVVHPLYTIQGKKIVTSFDPAKMVRQVVEFETLPK